MQKHLSTRENSKMLLISFLNTQFDISKQMLHFVRKVIKVMSSSRGRDKICGIFQYLFKMIALSAMESNISSVRTDFEELKLPFHFVAFKFWKNLSQARKIFRFLKFVDVIEELFELSNRKKDAKRLTNWLNFFSKICSFFYFILDNAVWFINTNIFEFFY